LIESKPRILVVDDDEGILLTMRAALEENGYAVETASNAEEAMQKTQTMTFNLALLDIKLPDIDGTELLTKLQNAVPKMRKIIITGYPSLQNSIEALNNEADAYLTKPIDMEKLFTVIEKQLEKQEEDRKYGETKIAEFIKTRVIETGKT